MSRIKVRRIDADGVPDGHVPTVAGGLLDYAAPAAGASSGSVRELTTGAAGGWQAVGKPNAAYYNGVTYWAYVRGDNGDACIRSYNHVTGEVSAETVLHAALNVDDHAGPTVLVRESDKRIVVVYCAHNGAAIYRRTSTNPEDIAAFGTEADIDSQLGGTNYTYPSLIQLTGEANDPVYLFVRRETLVAGQRWAYSTSTDGGSTWSALTTFFQVASRIAYCSPTRSSDTRIDFIAQDGSADVDASVSILHFYYEGGSWFKTNGTSSGALPIGVSGATKLHDGATAGSAHLSDVVPDDAGRPVVAYKVFASSTDVRYWWGRWTGSAWSTGQFATDGGLAGSYTNGDAKLDKAAPNVVYASRKISGVMQMFRYTTLDHGTTWAAEQLTSTAEHNIFPSVPLHRGLGLPVIWMRGTFTSATSYSTLTAAVTVPLAESEPHTHDATTVAALDDLTDVAISSPVEGDMLRYDGSGWVNTAGRWEPVVTDPGSGPELVFTATDVVMAWVES